MAWFRKLRHGREKGDTVEYWYQNMRFSETVFFVQEYDFSLESPGHFWKLLSLQFEHFRNQDVPMEASKFFVFMGELP